MPYCVVKDCKNYSAKVKKMDGISYYRFPRDPIRFLAWTKTIAEFNNDKHFKPKQANHICSDHFKKSDMYITNKCRRRRLLKTATPDLTVSTQTIRRRLKAIARKEANAEAGERGKSFGEARKGRQEARTCFKNIGESADHIETSSNASFEDNTSDSDNETINSQAFKPTSKVSSEDETSNQHVEIAIGRKEANAEARKPGKSFSNGRKGQQAAGTSLKNFGESADHIKALSKASFENNTSDSDNETINSQAFKPTSKVSSEDATSNQQVEITIDIEPTSNVSSKDETINPDMETLDTKALKVTLARIRANPQLYIGIPKNCYHLIDIIHRQTNIPTTHILLCLKKIKLDTQIEELADQFGITADEASDIFTSKVPALANILHTFVDNYDLQIPLRSEHSSCVIDSLEINVQPSSDNSRELTQTERGNTVKYMVCCTPDGYINYVSPGYGGRQSDDGLLEDTKYLDRLKSGDSVMPNGLRNVESMILQKGLKVVKPRARQKHTASMRATQHSTTDESQLSEDQVKRLVQRIREFTMIRDRSVLSCDLVRVLDEAVLISCALINLQSFVIN